MRNALLGLGLLGLVSTAEGVIVMGDPYADFYEEKAYDLGDKVVSIANHFPGDIPRSTDRTMTLQVEDEGVVSIYTTDLNWDVLEVQRGSPESFPGMLFGHFFNDSLMRMAQGKVDGILDSIQEVEFNQKYHELSDALANYSFGEDPLIGDERELECAPDLSGYFGDNKRVKVFDDGNSSVILRRRYRSDDGSPSDNYDLIFNDGGSRVKVPFTYEHHSGLGPWGPFVHGVIVNPHEDGESDCGHAYFSIQQKIQCGLEIEAGRALVYDVLEHLGEDQ